MERIEDLRFLFLEAEQRILERVRDLLLQLYWEVGYSLRTCSIAELEEIGAVFGGEFGVDAGMLQFAQEFYLQCPMKKNVGGEAQ